MESYLVDVCKKHASYKIESCPVCCGSCWLWARSRIVLWGCWRWRKETVQYMILVMINVIDTLIPFDLERSIILRRPSCRTACCVSWSGLYHNWISRCFSSSTLWMSGKHAAAWSPISDRQLGWGLHGLFRSHTSSRINLASLNTTVRQFHERNMQMNCPAEFFNKPL